LIIIPVGGIKVILVPLLGLFLYPKSNQSLMRTWLLTSLLVSLGIFAMQAQPVLSGVGAPLTLTFTGFGGAGFDPAPAADQLSSNAWASTGLSDGDLAFGQSITTGDYARGIVTAGGVTSGGIYALDAAGDQSLWVQATGSDFSPGSLTLRVVNGSGATLTSLDIAYDLLVFNDGDRGNTFDGSFSTDGITFTPVPALAYLSPETADIPPFIATVAQAATLSGLSIAPNDTFYLRWDSDDNLGGGSRDEFGLDDITFTGGAGVVATVANFATASAGFDEGAGTVSVSVALSTADTCRVAVSLATGGTATDGTDFTFVADTLTFSPTGSSSLSASVDLIDDMMIEGDETLFLVLDSAFNCSIGGVDTFELTIQDNDLPVYDIGLVTADADGDGAADSSGVTCELRGVVHGGDFNGGGPIQFTFIDPTGGIGLFSGNAFGYTVTEGDSIRVRGTISSFNGLAQIGPDTVILVSSGNALQTPVVITDLDESTESELVRFNNATIINPAQWTGAGSGFNVDVTNGTDTIQLRIDNDVDLYSLPAPVGTFDVIGLGGQFDNSPPANDGYQLLPRFQADIILQGGGNLPVYGIGLVTADADGDGAADSSGVTCELRGVVHGGDFNGGGPIQFTFIDPTGGIGLFSGNAFGYTVTEGDSVQVRGTISSFNGLAQIGPDTVIFVSSGNALQTPVVVTDLDESTESELVRFNNATIINPAQWTGAGSGFNVDITNGTDTIQLRIDNDVDLYSLPAPSGTFDVIGLGGQFDNSPPANDGYQLLPRYQADIIPVLLTGFSIDPTSLLVDEAAGTLTFDVTLDAPAAGATSVAVNLGTGTATQGVDFTGWNDTVLNFPAGSVGPLQLSLSVVDDNLPESDETIVIGLASPTGGPGLGDSVLTIVIEDNDYAVYGIGLITDDADNDGVADSVGVRCEIRGIVHSGNFRSSGLEFILIDSTGGITAFSFDDIGGYTVAVGDEVIIRGEVNNFNGLAQMAPDTLVLASAGNDLFTPMTVSTLDESTESEYLRMECFKLVDPTAWPASGSSANLLMTNTVDTVTMRIDSDTDLDGTAAPTGYFNLTGTGGQFDSSPLPATDGYQVRPSFLTELESFGAPVISLATAEVMVDEGADTLRIEVGQLNGNPETTNFRGELVFAQSTATEALDFIFPLQQFTLRGCGFGSDTIEIKIPILEDVELEGDETFVIRIFNATNGATFDIDTLTVTIVDNEGVGIPTLPASAIQLFPNPARQQARLRSPYALERVRLVNLMGQTVLEQRPQTQEHTLTLTNLPAGIYTVLVETEQGRWAEQLMLQR
jgi:hypothetical protein